MFLIIGTIISGEHKIWKKILTNVEFTKNVILIIGSKRLEISAL